jgi:arylsulfatase
MKPDEGGICSPMIVHWPDGTEKPKVVRHDPCHLVDILPTLLAASGGAYPNRFRGKPIQAPVDGIDISPTFRGERLPEDRNLYFSYGGKAVVNANWKAREHRKKWHLYDFSKDRTESRDVSGEHPEVLQKMVAAWNEYRKTHR